MLLIGSRALAAQDPTFKLNPDADWDFIIYSEDFKEMITTVIPKSEVEFFQALCIPPCNGGYASHYGCDYQDFREVQPRPVTKVEYF
jgi:hypothetical protein